MTRNPAALLADLVQIESHRRVDEVRDYLVATIENAEIHEESGCVIAEKGVEKGSPHVFLNSHMDVVAPHIPYREKDGVIYGRGSCDAKGCLAMLITAFESVEPDEGCMTLVLSPDEETYSEGLYDFLTLEGEKGDFAIVGEPTGLDVCDGARGNYKYEVELTGSAAHTGTRESGQSAVSCASKAIARIESIEQIDNNYLGTTDQTVSWVEGGPVGELSSKLPETVRFFVNRWSLPSETPEAFKSEIETKLADLKCDFDVCYPYQPNRFLESYRIKEDDNVIGDMVAAIEKVTDETPEVRPFPAAAESSLFQRFMPVAVFGPGNISDEGGPVAHSSREYLEKDELNKSVSSMEEFLTRVV